MPVLADTAVLTSLMLRDQLALWPTLYGRVIVPTVVLTVELPHPDAPAPVRAWVAQRTVHPPWLERRAPTRQPAAALLLLEARERATMLFAQASQADLVLMEDRDGRAAAARRGLTVYGTVSVVVRAAERGLVD
jgi:predicted nucleic acid-binding protein